MTSTLEEIQVGYDVSNEFFRLWLDEKMHYSCAIFDEDNPTLELAQRNKCRILADFAEVAPDSLVLDVGCGWGANVEYLARERMVKRVHGITLSPAQYDEAVSRRLPGVQLWCTDYSKFTPSERYDALVSIEMVDHLVSPQQQREGHAVAIYRDYFNCMAQWIKPGGYFGFQAILRDRVPRGRADLEDLQLTANVIFPGGLNPRLEQLVAASAPAWEILELVTSRENYGRTVAEWLRRMRANQATIMEKGWAQRLMSNGDTVWNNYERYLSACVRAFDNHWSSCVLMRLRRKP
jgi:cyclopropane-fatty-acyl-phospholipid synthase